MKPTCNRTLLLDFFHPVRDPRGIVDCFLEIPDFTLPLGIGFSQPDTEITLRQILSE